MSVSPTMLVRISYKNCAIVVVLTLRWRSTSILNNRDPFIIGFLRIIVNVVRLVDKKDKMVSCLEYYQLYKIRL